MNPIFPVARTSGFCFGHKVLKALRTCGVWLLLMLGPLQASAELPPLPVDFTIALRSLAQTFDPRDNLQWGARPIYGPDLDWSVRRSFNSERNRALMVELYSRGPLQTSTAGCLLTLVDAGRKLGKGDLEILVPHAVFQELQRTLRPPADADLRFKAPNQPKDGYRIHVTYRTR